MQGRTASLSAGRRLAPLHGSLDLGSYRGRIRCAAIEYSSPPRGQCDPFVGSGSPSGRDTTAAQVRRRPPRSGPGHVEPTARISEQRGRKPRQCPRAIECTEQGSQCGRWWVREEKFHQVTPVCVEENLNVRCGPGSQERLHPCGGGSCELRIAEPGDGPIPTALKPMQYPRYPLGLYWSCHVCATLSGAVRRPRVQPEGRVQFRKDRDPPASF